MSEPERAAVEAIAAAAEDADGVSPLDDQVRSELTYGAGAASHHLLARLPGSPSVVAYAHAVRDAAGASGHLVVHPDHRRRGIGREVADHLLAVVQTTAASPPSRPRQPAQRHPTLRLWAHGNTEGARALAAARGLDPARELWQMRRSLAEPLPHPSYPADVKVRTFEPGRDDEAWVALNARAFADHQEQGRLTVDDLRHRAAEPWFDPLGFFLAERDGSLLGSHWTKVQPGKETGSSPVGEVYAVGVEPGAQGLGLGKALTLTGLSHLRDEGVGEVMLYSDSDNLAAIGLYERLGFTTTRIDVMYGTS